MKESFEFLSGGMELFDRIKPLWEEQKAYHVGMSRNFAMERNGTQFEARKQEISQKSKEIKIIIAIEKANLTDIGYCISTIDREDKGEIDSVFIQECFRGSGLGTSLLESALTWMDQNNVCKKSLYIIAENEKAVAFYAKFGFYPRSIQLTQNQ